MSIALPRRDVIHYVNAFKEMLDTFPIIPIGLIKEISQYAAFAEYILRIGAILTRGSITPIIDVQSFDSAQPFLCGYFNLVQATYFQFRGITDKAKECCEKTFMVIHKSLEQLPHDPNLNMMIWSYWLVYRNLENPNTGHAFDMTSLPVPQSLITPQTAEILAIEQNIASKKNIFQTKFIHNHNKSRKGVLVARFSTLLHNAENAENAVQCACDYVRTASTLSISDRLPIFWREVIYLNEITKVLYDSEIQQYINSTTLYKLLFNANAFNLNFTQNEKYHIILEQCISQIKEISRRLEAPQIRCEQWIAYIPDEERRQGSAINELTDEQEYRCEWCSNYYDEKRQLRRHRKLHTTRGKKKKVAYIPEAAAVIEEERRQNDITKAKRQQYRCEWCGDTFQANSHLQRHRELHTTRGKKKKVAYIPEAASIIEEERRQEDIIKVIRKYRCEWCSSSFDDQFHLDTHRELHTTHGKKKRVAYIPEAASIIEEERRQRKATGRYR